MCNVARRGWSCAHLIGIVACLPGGCSRPGAGDAPGDVPAPWGPPLSVETPGRVAGPPAVADLNNDRTPDIVVPIAGEAGGVLLALLGDGRGGFRAHDAPTDLPLPGDAIWVAAADLNGDGRPDAVVGQHDSYDLLILLGDGDGGFEAAPQSPVTIHDGAGAHTHSLILADVNGDDREDILATCADDNAVAVLLGDGAGGFDRAAGSHFGAGEHPYEGLCVGAVNDDDHLDIVVPNLWGGSISVLLGDGTGRFEHAAASPLAVGARPGYLAVGRLDGDDYADVIVTRDEASEVVVLLGSADGSLEPAPGSPVPVPQGVWEAAVADVDGDELSDVVLGGRQDRVIVLLGDGRGGFDEQIEKRMPHPGPGRVRLADLNQDRKLDLIVTYFDQSVIEVCLGR